MPLSAKPGGVGYRLALPTDPALLSVDVYARYVGFPPGGSRAAVASNAGWIRVGS